MQSDKDRISQAAPLWTRAIVLLNALVFVDFGLAFFAKPQALARLLEIELSSPTALADLRAMYGGLALAVGALLCAGSRRAEWLVPSLWLVIATSGGLALGRLYSVLASGVPSGMIFGFLASELGSLLWAILAYRALAGRELQQPALGAASSS
jgi:hypothetical protein